MDKYQEYFNQAAARFRITGAGGLQVPNPDLTRNPSDPVKVDPARQVVMKGDWVVVGGSTVKKRDTKGQHAQVLGVSAKIVDAIRKEDAAKKNQKNN